MSKTLKPIQYQQDRRSFLRQGLSLSVAALALSQLSTPFKFLSRVTAHHQLIASAGVGDIEGMRWAFQQGADINGWVSEAEIASGYECLMVSALGQAAKHNHTKAIHWLLERKADPNGLAFPSDNFSEVPLMYAHSIGAADLLLHYGANPNLGDSGEICSALYSQLSHKDVFDHLLHNGADIDCFNNCGSSILGIAIRWGFSVEDIRFLFSRGANIRDVGSDESAALKAALCIIDCFGSSANFVHMPKARDAFLAVLSHPNFDAEFERKIFRQSGFNFDTFVDPNNLYATEYPFLDDTEVDHRRGERFRLEAVT